MYSYEFTSKALKDIKRLDKPTQRHIIQKLDVVCKSEVLTQVQHLVKHRIGSFRLRAGDYRMIMDIDGKMITVLKIGHRRDIYK